MAIRCSSVCLQRPLCRLETCPGTAGRMRRTEGAQPAGGRLIVAHLPPAGGVRGLFVGYLRLFAGRSALRVVGAAPGAAVLQQRFRAGQMDAAVRAAPWPLRRRRAGRAAWAAGNRARVARRRHAGGDAGHAQHRDDDDDPEQQLAHVQPRCRIISSTNRLPV